jgi:MoxR-like ATPase
MACYHRPMMNNFDYFANLGAEFLPGNELQLKLGLSALILNRNVLIEDVPGMGKTTLVKFFAKICDLELRRIQFTSDLLPSDILGVSIFNKETEKFVFKAGPIFGELVLADELNRGTPKTQSALLQAMEEKHITVDGLTYPLPEKFCLFATQNPRGQFGTYPLPESQLDRFLFKFPMGHLSKTQELNLLATGSRLEKLEGLKAIFGKNEMSLWAQEIHRMKVSPFLLEYITDILSASRNQENTWGLSPRAGLDLLEAAKAWGFLAGRDHVLPDDVQAVFPYVAGHRMYSGQSLPADVEGARAKELIGRVPILKGS